MTTTDAPEITLLVCRLDPLALLPRGTDVTPPADGVPALVTLATSPLDAEAVNAMDEGSTPVFDHTTGLRWVVQYAPQGRIGRAPLDREVPEVPLPGFIAYPEEDIQPSFAEATDAPPSYVAPEAEAEAEPEPAPEVEVEVIRAAYDEPLVAHGRIIASLWNGSHDPIPDGTLRDGGMVLLDVDRDQFEMLTEPILPADVEHRGIIDRRTGARWCVTASASWMSGADRYRARPETAMADAPMPQGESPEDRRARLAVVRLGLAQAALVETGLWTVDDVGDDIAGRIRELYAHINTRTATAQRINMVPEGLGDTFATLAEQLAAASKMLEGEQ